MGKRHIETIAIQAGRNPDAQTGAVMPPIHLSTTYIRGNDEDFVYSRVGNPNRNALETCLKELEGGAG
ncbi:MAG: PLP-dependent transferase, partial [Chloroflexota bacterium]